MPEHIQPQAFSRMDQSFLGMWWWTVDRVMLACLLCLMVFGVALVATASPSVADKIDVPDYHFLIKHVIFLFPSAVLMIALSMFSSQSIWRIASVVMVVTLLMLVVVPIIGAEVKGAKRWVSLFGFSVQPSEFIKPSFAVVAAWLISRHQDIEGRHKIYDPQNGLQITTYNMSFILYGLIISLLLLQPDLGMSVVLTIVFGVQIFLAGMRFRYLAVLGGLGSAGLLAAYFSFHHVRSRVDRFFNPESGDNYQVERALDAIKSGGFLGVGPGQGEKKMFIPDAHADFIFSVLVEEMGFLFAMILIGLFVFIVLRGFKRLQDTHDVFSVIAVGGLLTMFGVQALIHVGANVNLLPAKGMTLPFISYGGSSMISIAMAMGMVLALTRQKKRGTVARSSVTMRLKRSDEK